MSFHIVQIGCGVVGYAYVKAFEKMGFKVTCLEASKTFIENNKNNHTCYHVNDDLNDIKDVDFILLSINTPLKGKKLDLTYLFSSIRNVAVIMKNNPNATVVLRSTVPPGTSHKYKNELEAACGQTVKVLFQPEFLRDKTCFQDAMNPWHVVIGRDEGENVDNFKEMYKYFVDESSITEMSIDEAEYLKMIHNSFNAAKISFFNQCKLLVDAINEKEGRNMNIHVISDCITKTCEGLMNPKYGTKAGHAYGGACLVKDSTEFASLEEQYGLQSHLFREVVEVNKIYQKTDDKEIIHGDHHMDFQHLKKISSSEFLKN
jgi:UDPglucose 6-dehydrogenase